MHFAIKNIKGASQERIHRIVQAVSLLVLTVCLTTNARAQSRAWTDITQPGAAPPPRAYSATAYDSIRNRVVMFGGSNHFNSSLRDTWELDGDSWTRRSTTGPSARTYAAMAYDSAHGRVVLFGGNSSSNLGDTWEWDGTTWTLRASTGPSPRNAHSMAYDSFRGRTVLFGGAYSNGTTQFLNDTWEWDGTSWMQVATAGPSLRSASSMAYDSARGRVVLFGGAYPDANNNVIFLGDTWEWDGVSWTQVASTGPSPRYGHTMAFDSARNRLVLFGGYDSTVQGDTWEWDGTSWILLSTTGPSRRAISTMSYDSARNRLLLFGGNDYTGTYRGDTWQYHRRTPLAPVDAPSLSE